MEDGKKSYGIILVCSIIFAMTFILSYRQITMLNDDMATHISFAAWDNIKSGNLVHFGWHVIVCIFSLAVPKAVAASIVNATFNMLAVVVVFIVLKYYLNQKMKKNLLYLLTFSLVIIEPIWLPNGGERFFRGAFLPNPWHNPTYMAVKAIGIMCLFLVFWGIEKIERDEVVSVRYWIVAAGLGVVSEIMKPSFMQVFLPALVIWIAIFKRKEKIRAYMPVLYAMLPSALYILCQFLILAGQGTNESGGGFAIGLFVFWRNAASNMALAFIQSYLFPILLIAANPKCFISKERNQYILVFWMVAFMEFAFLYENNIRKYDGNLAWGLLGASLILFIDVVIEYMERREYFGKAWRWLLDIVLAMHVVTGGVYYIYLLFSRFQQ